MDTYIRSKPIGLLTEQEVQECRGLTMGKKGEMRRTLDTERRHARPPFCRMMPPSHQMGRAIMLRECATGDLLGWTLLVWMSGEAFMSIYVLKQHRRTGIGRRLHRHVQRFAAEPAYLASGRSERFFQAVAA